MIYKFYDGPLDGQERDVHEDDETAIIPAVDCSPYLSDDDFYGFNDPNKPMHLEYCKSMRDGIVVFVYVGEKEAAFTFGELNRKKFNHDWPSGSHEGD